MCRIQGQQEKQIENISMNMKEIIKRVLFPHTFFVFLLFNISIAGLVYVFTHNMEKHPLAYVVYPVSSYMLVTVCVRIPGIIKYVKEVLHANKYTDRYLTDKDLRMQISMYRGLVITFVFAIFKIVMGFVYNSSWFFAMAGYNVILSLMRFVLIYYSQKKGLSEYEEQKRGLQSYQVCGWLMMVLNIAVSVIMFMVVVQEKTIQYHMIVSIGLAAFTFYCFTRAIINMIKYWKHKNPVYAAVKRIDMVKAIVSVFTLQVTMLTTFNEGETVLDVRFMNILTGIVVTIAVNTIGAMMIARSKEDFRKLETRVRDKKE